MSFIALLVTLICIAVLLALAKWVLGEWMDPKLWDLIYKLAIAGCVLLVLMWLLNFIGVIPDRFWEAHHWR